MQGPHRAGSAQGPVLLHREVDTITQVIGQRRPAVVQVDGHRVGHRGEPLDRQVDEGPTADRAQSLRALVGQRRRRGAAPRGEATRTAAAILMGVQPRQWTNQRQPQTLQIAVFLLYTNAVFAVLFGRAFSLFGLLFAVGSAVAGYQIANERRWGYRLGVAVLGHRASPLLLILLINLGRRPGNLVFLIQLVFPVALFVALVHPISREYERIWFD